MPGICGSRPLTTEPSYWSTPCLHTLPRRSATCLNTLNIAAVTHTSSPRSIYATWNAACARSRPTASETTRPSRDPRQLLAEPGPTADMLRGRRSIQSANDSGRASKYERRPVRRRSRAQRIMGAVDAHASHHPPVLRKTKHDHARCMHAVNETAARSRHARLRG